MTTRSGNQTLAFGSGAVAVTVSSNDPDAARWLTEYLAPWFAPWNGRAAWRLRIVRDAAAYREARRRRPDDAEERAWFAFDTHQLSLPTWSAPRGIEADDSERSCVLAITPDEVDLIGDPATRRWRFTASIVLAEIAATRMRRTSLDLHSAAVVAAGRAALIVGPKGAGKSTLAFYLLRSGSWRALANDRTFASAGGESLLVYGAPTAVKIRPPTLAQFPELVSGVPALERLYLYSLDELARETAHEQWSSANELPLSPPQLMRQLAVEPVAHAAPGAILFPRLAHDVEGHVVERLDPAEVRAGIRSNLYGRHLDRRSPTLFEELGGGISPPSQDLIDELARAVPGYRLALGRHAYASSDLAAALLDTIAP